MVDLDGLAEHEATIAALMARVADLEAQAVIDRSDIEGLHTALDTARCIGAAVGIIMVSFRLREDEAFHVLRRVSQTTNRKLRDIAVDVVETGALPG